MLMHDYQTHNRPVYKFIEKLLIDKEKYEFSEYIDKMTQYFENVDDCELMMEVLSEKGRDYIERDTLKEVLEEVIGRELMVTEMNDIMAQMDLADQ